MSNGEGGPPFRVTNLSFRALLQRLGIIPYPQLGFTFDTTIVPVSIVDSDILLESVSNSPTLGIPFTNGQLLTIVALQVLADTGPLPAGNYNVRIWVGIDSNVAGAGGNFTLVRRDAADAADVWSQVFTFRNDAKDHIDISARIALGVDERLRIAAITAWTVGARGQASIWASL